MLWHHLYHVAHGWHIVIDGDHSWVVLLIMVAQCLLGSLSRNR